MCAGLAGPATARWSRTAIVYEPQSCAAPLARPALDAHGNRWVSCELLGPAQGLWVGRVTPRYGPVAARLVPGTVGFRVDGGTLAISAHGIAALAWSFAEPHVAWWEAKEGTAATIWRLGQPPGSPTVLNPAATGSPGERTVAINSRGTAIVLFDDGQGVKAARLRAGRPAAVETLDPTNERLQSLQVFATPDDGFQASWALASSGKPNVLEAGEATVGRAHAGRDGVFSVEAPAKVPLLLTPPSEPSYDRAWSLELNSNIEGDQLLTWGASGPGGRTDYAISRRSGQPFAGAQVLGTPPAEVSLVRSVIGPTGRFTALWTGARAIEATAGAAGGAVSAPRPYAYQARPVEDLGVLPDGTTVALWVHEQHPYDELGSIEAASSRDGVHFTPSVVISRSTRRIAQCNEPRLLVSTTHSAIAEWVCGIQGAVSGGTIAVEIARYSS